MAQAPIKVLHYVDTLPELHSDWGGAEQASKNLIYLLKSSNKIIQEVICLPWNNNNNKLPPFFKDVSLKEFPSWEYSFKSKKFIRFIQGLRSIYFPFDFFNFFLSLFLLKKIKPDILHVHSLKKTGFSLILAAKLLNIKVLFSVYDYWILCPRDVLFNYNTYKKCDKPSLYNCYHCYAPKRFINLHLKIFNLLIWFRQIIIFVGKQLIDSYIVFSESSKKILSEFLSVSPKKVIKTLIFIPIKILPSGLKENKKINNNKTIILFIGWINPNKGLHIVVKALKELIKKYKITNIELKVYGGISDTNYYNEILNFIKETKIKKYIKIRGKIPHKKVINELKKGDIIIVPEQWENVSPVVIVESFTIGKCVLGSNIGGIPEYIKDKERGILFNPYNYEELAIKLKEVILNSTKCRRYGKEGYNWIRKEYKTETFLRKWERIYKKLYNINKEKTQ